MAAEDKKPNIFEKMLDVGSAMLDAQLYKARNSMVSEQSGEVNFGKAITRDRTYYMGSQGFFEKPTAISYEYQKQIAIKSSIVSAIIKTRQNRVAAHSQYVPEGTGLGFKIVLKHEQELLEEIKEELFGEEEDVGDGGEKSQSAENRMSEMATEVRKAVLSPEAMETLSPQGQEAEVSDEEKNRIAKKEMQKRSRKKKQAIAEFILNCGELKDRPFESKMWNFDAYLRAITWDSLVFDQVATEKVPKEAQILQGRMNIHHFFPVDASTIRFASPALSKYKTADLGAMGQDILYSEEEIEGMERRDALDLDAERLEKDEYKYVQLIRGRIARAFTEDEIAFGMRNPVTDIFANGYAISEIELLVALITSHLQTEFYNRSYFSQGFSAKGILHVKANLNRSKLEELRRHWNHMVKGNRNSFQTPIMAGMDEVQWIPLTQSHSEMEFSLWLNYLIRMICAIYQIDPIEIGYGMKDEGGAGMSGDNTAEKLKNSKDKGFTPLMTFIQNYINKNIIDELDPDYMLEWTGLQEEGSAERIARQSQEVKFKKSINEIREEDGLPPIKGADQLILDPVFFQWFTQFSDTGKKQMEENQAKMMQQTPISGAGEEEKPEDEKADKSEPASDEKFRTQESAKENDHMRDIEKQMLAHQNNLELADKKDK
jgi:hypothetical protein